MFPHHNCPTGVDDVDGSCKDVGSLDVPPFTWPTTVEDIKASTAKVISMTEENLNKIASVQLPTFANVIYPLMCQPNYKTNALVCQAKFLQHASPDATLRAAAEEAGKRFAALKAKSRTRADIYAKVKEFAATAETKALGPHETHFVEALVKDFERGGLALEPTKRAELQRLLDADAELCARFLSNLSSDKTTTTFRVEQLTGLPETFIRDRLNADGEVTLTLKSPDLLPTMSQCEVGATREAMMKARESAYANNLELVAEAIILRKKIANLLGYKSWSHYVMEARMAETPEVVSEFLHGILKLAKDKSAKDQEEIRRAKIHHLKTRGELPAISDGADVVLEAWDVTYYSNLILKRDHNVDQEAIREYFPLDHVVASTLGTYQELLGLEFVELLADSFSRWHNTVRCFVVRDAVDDNAKQGSRVGHFYLDLHPREGKYAHAAVFHLLKRKGNQAAVDVMMCNFPDKSSDGTPALLRHDDVVTFFHEFGHIMHGLCAEGDGNSTHIAKCPRDFVEAPSQMLENWCWQPQVLARLSKHHKTGAPLPDAMLEALIAAKNVYESLSITRQVYLATLDLHMHGVEPPLGVDGLQALVNQIRPEITGVRNPPGNNFLRCFGHLMKQYSAAYYGYLWAEVISADMFETRFKDDCLSVESGMAYRRDVLAPGGSGKIMEHISKFLGGRAPKQEPFLRSRGLI
eukprot:TRINITY_DN38196_c0_g1_i1.p1 TRINITY_DN38196_c0_g1~~TRINITY_DN38196_c0_g1_i1.p1  ORF type:complete len:694 (-),score=100.88 TRINITY_DN38196_c0_g1_i1:560-2641(-)